MTTSTIVDHLVAMYERDGKLTPEQVLAEAQDPSSLLHASFEWDDTIAAHQYRISQAAELLRRAEVTILEKPCRKLIYLPSTRSYHPIERVVADKDWRAEMIDEFRRDADRFKARWQSHKHVADHYQEWLKDQIDP